ncbi:MAG: alkaline phosphatase D family protein [Bryobacterales bacterium]|nr:alkaline phosphatase D family protein [Bryobacterales bacterium]
MLNRRQACLLLASAPAAAFQSELPSGVDRPWIGPEYWANPLQDWRLRDGRIECFQPGGDRNVYLLTHEAAGEGTLLLRVRTGRLDFPGSALATGFVGFRVGIRGFFDDYRDSAVYGTGVHAGLATDGRLFIGTPSASTPQLATQFEEVELRLEIAAGSWRLAAHDKQGELLGEVRRTGVPAEWQTGGLALVCHSGDVHPTPEAANARMTFAGIVKRGQENGGTLRFWFRDWRVEGSSVRVHPERALGPILFSMYTVHRGVLKLTAQMMPVDSHTPVQLQVKRGAAWRTIASAPVEAAARTATFRVEKWNAARDTPYRVSYRGQHWEGTVRRDPADKAEIVVAGLSCNNDLGFPHADVVRNVRHFAPDLIAFTGDQIYERCGGFGIQRAPLERATLDYLRKWYLFGWEYRELTKDIPCVCLPDDHDVYHGNIWGAGGRKAEGPPGAPGQDSGGYVQAADWVNMVQRTQTSHMPDAHDPTPIDQNIGVYYGAFTVGGVSFAVLEDRKWKSAPKEAMPEARIVNGWAQNPQWSAPRDGDVAGAQLLGARQLKFLDEWAADWRGGVWMKCVISQTIFANLATLPKPANTDAVTPGLPIEPVGGHGRNEIPTADHDSNGWPQSGRNAALRAMRRGLAFHIAGDQHLGSTIHYGVDEWNDAGWAVCVPAIANIFPRRWYPPEPGRHARAHDPRCTGEFVDGFGNKVTVAAVFNPQAFPHEPKPLHQRAPGYGIIRFHRGTRRIHVTNWPRWVDAAQPGALPCPGWPVEIEQLDNGMPRAHSLGEVTLPRAGIVAQVVADESGEVQYTVRVAGDRFTPGVARPGRYRVRWQDERTGRWQNAGAAREAS